MVENDSEKLFKVFNSFAQQTNNFCWTLDKPESTMSLGSTLTKKFPNLSILLLNGPLGAGISNAVGIAIAETHLAAKFNKPDCNIVGHYTYVIMGDGCNQEGIASEACSLAGHLKLGKLIALYDDNHITIDGRTDVSFTEDVLKRYEAYGWHVQHVEDGNHDVNGITQAIKYA